MRAEVLEAMLPYLDERFGNPSSTHRWGRQARNALEQAREQVAAALGAKRREIVFTGSGTEADNIAVLGRWRSSCRGENERGAVVCTAIEHKAVGAAAKCAAEEGAQLILLGVDEEGRIDLASVDEALTSRPCVVSVMWANNEVGTIEPVAEVSARCRAAGIVFHTDAVQAFGKLRVRVDETACDLLSISGHKVGGPKGIGALYIREGTQVLPLFHGGGQERELRPGTENVASAVGFAVAAEFAAREQHDESARLEVLRDRLQAGITQRVSDVVINGPRNNRLPNILSLIVPGTDQEALLIGLDLEGVAVSGGSACQSGTVKPSHVLSAMGAVGHDGAAVRMSLGKTTTLEEIDLVIDAFERVVEQSRVSV